MSSGPDDRSTRFARWWVRRYTAGLRSHETTARRAEIDSDLSEHARYRQLSGWTSKQISRERLRRLLRGMAADVSWRHEIVAGQCSVRGLVRVSVMSITSVASVMLAIYQFAFAAYLLGSASLADQPFLGGLENYADEVGRPIASVVAALVLAGLGAVVLAATLARPISPVMANVATIPSAAVAVMWFWLGIWPIGIVAVLGSVLDLASRAPTQAPQAADQAK